MDWQSHGRKILSITWLRSKGGMAAHQGVGVIGRSRLLSGTLPQALGSLSALGAGRVLWELSSHRPGNVSVLMLVPRHLRLHWLGRLSSSHPPKTTRTDGTSERAEGYVSMAGDPPFCSSFAALTHGFSDVLLLLLWILQSTRRNHPLRPSLCPCYLVQSRSQKQSLMLEEQDPRLPRSYQELSLPPLRVSPLKPGFFSLFLENMISDLNS